MKHVGTRINFIGSKDDVRRQIDSIRPLDGICCFIDICGSTAIKNQDFMQWVIQLSNTFRLISGSIGFMNQHIIKTIGDELMIFIPLEAIPKDESFYTILLSLNDAVSGFHETTEAGNQLRSKASIHYCEGVYNIHFNDIIPNDFYGLDIDLTARLMKKAEEGKIIVSEAYYQRMDESQRSLLPMYEGVSDSFKGIEQPVAYRVIKTEPTK